MAPDVRCECGEPGCEEVLPVAHERHADPRVRMVAPGHVSDSGTVILLERPTYWLVRSIAPDDESDDPSALSFPTSDPPAGPSS